MQDVELYRHLLGLQSPWSVSKVGLAVKEQRVDVWAEHSDQKFPCPECDRALPLYDHAEERVWRHLDSCQFMTYLHARIPRVECPQHGVKQVRVPWAEPKSRFTALFERFAIDVLHEASISGAMRILRISWDEAMALMERAVKRGLLRKEKRVVRRIGVDEKSTTKGHNYFTLVNDLDGGTVEGIEDDRQQSSLESYFRKLTPEQLEGIQAVAMDMWQPFVRATLNCVPGAADKIVYDKFHIMWNMSDAVDRVRRSETRELRLKGSNALVGSRHVWLYGAENLPERYAERFAELKALNLKTGRAWAIKESLRLLWSFRRPHAARRYYDRWYAWAIRSRLPRVVKVARMLHSRLHNVMTYFQHRITNAVAEGLNSKIQTIKKRAYGFRNNEHFKIAIYFHCGGLDLYPRPLAHAKP